MNPDHKKWFRKAENDLVTVENNLQSVIIPTDTVCYHCQQTAEKYLKGYLTFHNVEFEKIHNLNLILQQCIDIDSSFEELRENVRILNSYGPSIRYPDFIDDPSKEEALNAHDMALSVKTFVLRQIE